MGEDTGFQFTDDAVPRAYEEVLVPRLFEPWALLLLDECNLGPNAVVLDVATGPGTVARLGPNGSARAGALLRQTSHARRSTWPIRSRLCRTLRQLPISNHATLRLTFEGGIAQATRALAATPLAPSLATLPVGTHLILKAAIGAHLAPLLRDGKVSVNMTSNIAIARA